MKHPRKSIVAQRRRLMRKQVKSQIAAIKKTVANRAKEEPK